ncbi:MAG: hypothetical protein HC890_13815 [Chloroflexaceae bacterium]|nr:hypothetical protein [Chloroflexaceae bacterium]
MSDGIELTRGGQKKLGSLVNIKDLTIAEAIRERGGAQSQVAQVRTDYQNFKVGELANLAAEGDPDAETAIKIMKQAKKKREKYE